MTRAKLIDGLEKIVGKIYGENFIDVTIQGRGVGFIVPVVVSAAAWNEAVDFADMSLRRAPHSRARERRLLAVLLEALQVARTKSRTDAAIFHITRFSRVKAKGRADKLSVVKTSFFMQCKSIANVGPVVIISLSE